MWHSCLSPHIEDHENPVTLIVVYNGISDLNMDSHFYDPVVLYVLPGPNQIQMLKLRYYERFDRN